MMNEKFNEPCETYYEIFTDKPTKGYKYSYLSPFEFKNILISTANKSFGEKNVLNAGRGNPNFYSTLPRYAFALLLQICTELGDEICDFENIAYIPEKKSIGKRFYKLLHDNRNKKAGKFLKEACDKMRIISNISTEDFVLNLVISTIGCFYPNPPRVQNFVEPVLVEFLDKKIYRSQISLKGRVKIMPTEGAASAILYVLDSLKYNGLVIQEDIIGILTPIFSPYLEIPSLLNYKLKQVCIKADPDNNWEIPQSEIEKITDKNMKALFLVNPTNPTGMSLSTSTIRKIASVVRRNNPDLIIIEDNVYAPFVREFNSFFNILPRNTIGIFSFSKYFGTTGWRLGTIIMHDNNIIDNKLLKISPADVHDRYKILTTNPKQLKFIDRILADSRQVAEAHVAGLSTPQQTLMTLFAIHDLFDGHEYQETLDEILIQRMEYLLKPLNHEPSMTNLNSNYYIVIDISNVADKLMGDSKFGYYLRNNRDPLEFLLKLAKKYGIVLLPGVGFAGPFWSVRISLANLHTENYSIIGEGLRMLIEDYYIDFKKYKIKTQL